MFIANGSSALGALRMIAASEHAAADFGRPIIKELLAELKAYGGVMEITDDIDPNQIPLEQVVEMEEVLKELVEWVKNEYEPVE